MQGLFSIRKITSRRRYWRPKSRTFAQLVLEAGNDPARVPVPVLEWAIIVMMRLYEKGRPAASDEVFDDARDALRKRRPRSPVLKLVGSPEAPGQIRQDMDQILASGKVPLPYWMGSMDKSDSPSSFAYGPPYVISDKLDGVSLLYVNVDGDHHLYTRGNGRVGQDVSHLIPVIGPRGLPRIPARWAIRGELIMGRKTFDKGFGKQFANPRNMIAGMVNRKSVSRDLRSADFIAHELLNPRRNMSTGLAAMRSRKFVVVPHEVLDARLDAAQLSDMLRTRRANSEYEMDGLIVTSDKRHAVNTSGNPDYAFAFKIKDVSGRAKVRVLDVEWNASRHNLLKPVVIFEPTNIGGVTVQRATAHTGRYIVDHRIGRGSVLEVIRSGDVIPYIDRVVRKAKTAILPKDKWVWDRTDTNMIRVGEASDQSKASALLFALRALGLEKIGPGKADGLVLAGVRDLQDLREALHPQHRLHRDARDVLGPKLMLEMRLQLDSTVRDASVPALLMASGLLPYGIGPAKLESMMAAYPTIMAMHKDRIAAIGTPPPGMSIGTFRSVTAILPQFKQWAMWWGVDLREGRIIASPLSKATGKLAGNVYVFTGFRDIRLERVLMDHGAEVGKSVTRKTTHLVIRDPSKESRKTEAARQKGVEIVTLHKIMEDLGLSEE